MVSIGLVSAAGDSLDTAKSGGTFVVFGPITRKVASSFGYQGLAFSAIQTHPTW